MRERKIAKMPISRNSTIYQKWEFINNMGVSVPLVGLSHDMADKYIDYIDELYEEWDPGYAAPDEEYVEYDEDDYYDDYYDDYFIDEDYEDYYTPDFDTPYWEEDPEYEEYEEYGDYPDWEDEDPLPRGYYYEMFDEHPGAVIYNPTAPISMNERPVFSGYQFDRASPYDGKNITIIRIENATYYDLVRNMVAAGITTGWYYVSVYLSDFDINGLVDLYTVTLFNPQNRADIKRLRTIIGMLLSGQYDPKLSAWDRAERDDARRFFIEFEPASNDDISVLKNLYTAAVGNCVANIIKKYCTRSKSDKIDAYVKNNKVIKNGASKEDIKNMLQISRLNMVLFDESLKPWVDINVAKSKTLRVIIKDDHVVDYTDGDTSIGSILKGVKHVQYVDDMGKFLEENNSPMRLIYENKLGEATSVICNNTIYKRKDIFFPFGGDPDHRLKNHPDEYMRQRTLEGCLFKDYKEKYNIVPIKDPDTIIYVKSACHWTPQFVKAKSQDDIKKGFDRNSAYLSWKSCSLYEKFRFPKNITHFYDLDNIPVGSDLFNKFLNLSGFFQITDIQISEGEEFEYIKRTFLIRDKNIYPSPLLYYLNNLGVKFSLKSGCWSTVKSRMSPPAFNDKRINLNIMGRFIPGDNISPVAVECSSKNDLMHVVSNNFDDVVRYTSGFNGNPLDWKSIFESVPCPEQSGAPINSEARNGSGQSHEQSETSDKKVDNLRVYLKTHNDTPNAYYHIYAYILAYNQICMLEKLTKIKFEDIVKVNVDSIYVTPSKFDKYARLFPFSKNKGGWKVEESKRISDFVFEARKFDNVFSSDPERQTDNKIVDVDKFITPLNKFNVDAPRSLYLHNKNTITGEAGTGKTHLVCEMCLYKFLYLAPTNKLAGDKGVRYNCDSMTLDKFITLCKMNEKYICGVKNILLDEGYMVSAEKLITFINSIKKYVPNIFIAYDDCQLGPIAGTPITNLVSNFNNVTLSENHRQASEDFQDFLRSARTGNIDVSGLDITTEHDAIRSCSSDPSNVILCPLRDSRSYFNKKCFSSLPSGGSKSDIIIPIITLTKRKYKIPLMKTITSDAVVGLKLFKSERLFIKMSEFECLEDKERKHLDLCYAATIHIFQGSECYNYLYIDMERIDFTPNLLYVAMSRVLSKEQIKIIPYVLPKINRPNSRYKVQTVLDSVEKTI